MDMGTMGALLTSITAVKTIAQGLLAARDEALIREKTTELSIALLSVLDSAIATQAEQSALLRRIDSLEREVNNAEAWKTKERLYDLSRVVPGTQLFAYALKEEIDRGNPSHYLCAGCFGHKQISILQSEMRFPGRCQVLACHECGSALYVAGHPHSDHVKTGRRK